MSLPRTLRGRLTLVLAAGSVVLVGILILAFNVVLRSQIHADLDTRLRERASAALANVVVRHGKIVVREAPGDQAIDQQVWVFGPHGLAEASPEPAAATAAARAAVRRPNRFSDTGSLDLRFYTKPLAHGAGAIVVAGSLTAYETIAERALVASIVLGILVVAGILVASRLAISAALRPVDRMTAEAAVWSVDDLDHRFAGTDGHDEIARLARTFNDLLARLSASFRHEQRFTAELSHELRTPLAKLIFEGELALRRERSPAEYRHALEGIVRDARQMQGVIETLLAVARSEIDPRSGTADASLVARSVVDSLRAPGAPEVELAVHTRNGPPRVGVDAEVAERVLAPVVANALQFARRHAALEVTAEGAMVEFVVRDDGPGVAPGERESIFLPGYRADGTRPAGTGLGLALARRLAQAADGDVRCLDSPEGAAFVVSLPSA